MLEIRNLTKIYKTKGGTDVKALDDVSVSFQKTGLVFLLGKSGSGKSTLLNLIGGLDEPTEGEVVVMGKSSKEFSGSDFDSYRNTYVGFIFQEYNILNEFNVEDNIAIALELQGKRKDKEKVAEILHDVELSEYAKRKPNTLSGGQKQRVAIARALIKDPQIIMADEPTGALDSQTGKQVFETLKRLSKSRLVLVVSHDREFASTYGDRIIELSDGRIIADFSKVKEEPEHITPDIIRHNEDTLTIKSGKITQESLVAIENFILNSKGDILISKNQNDIEGFKRATRIDESGATEHFGFTPAYKADYTEPAKFIRSKLPLSKAIKIGASSLKLKTFRLILTIFLTIFSFVMFGLFSTMILYNDQSVLTQSFLNSDYDYAMLKKQYQTTQKYNNDNEVTPHKYETKFTPSEVSSFGDDAFGVYNIYINGFQNLTISSKNTYYYHPSISKVAALPESHPLRANLKGNYPTSFNEIAISSYLVECLKNGSYKQLNGEVMKINSADDIIGQYLNVSGLDLPLKVTGVFDSGIVPATYDELKTYTEDNWYNSKRPLYLKYLSESTHTLALLSESYITTVAEAKNNDFIQYHSYFDKTVGNSVTFFSIMTTSGTITTSLVSTSYLKVYKGDNRLPIVLFKNINTLAPNQIIVSFETLNNYFRNTISSNVEETNAYNAIRAQMNLLTRESYADGNRMITPTNAQRWEAAQAVLPYITERLPLKISITKKTGAAAGQNMGEFEIVGAYISDFKSTLSEGFFCSDDFYSKANIITSITETNYAFEEDAIYDRIMIPVIKDNKALKATLLKLDTLNENDVVFSMENMLNDQVKTANGIVKRLSPIFFWIGFILALFASLLLFNFISLSIVNKKKEIGILRAVGARGLDVFKIFFAESLIIVGICAALSFVGTAIVCVVLNNSIKAAAGLEVALFIFGPLSILIMLGIALIVSFISTFLPVYFAAKKKPVDSIRAL